MLKNASFIKNNKKRKNVSYIYDQYHYFTNHASTKQHFLSTCTCCVDERNVSLNELEAGYTSMSSL